jgi:hypothetical protein
LLPEGKKRKTPSPRTTIKRIKGNFIPLIKNL